MLISPRLLQSLLWMLLPLLSLLSLSLGEIPLSWAELWQVDSSSRIVLWELRLPRLLLIFLAGILLAVSGAVIQALFRNPLADPSLIGVSAGAGLASVTVLVLAGSLLVGWASVLALPVAAFAGGLVATWLVAKIASNTSGLSVTTMLLAGIAVNAIAAAGISLLQYLADELSLRQTLLWLLGGMQYGGWPEVIVLSCVAAPAIYMMLAKSQQLNLLLLGEKQARLLGVPVEQLRRRLIFLAALAVGSVVAVGGMIGFVGLVVPHWVRLLCGPDHRSLLPLSALLGGLFLLVADIVARQLLAPTQLPIGIVTALVGGPFFLSMILYRRRA